VRAAFLGADQGTIADYQGQLGIQFMRDGHGKVVAAPSDQGDLDATAGGFGNGGAVGLRKLPAAIQERSVNIQRNEPHGHP